MKIRLLLGMVMVALLSTSAFTADVIFNDPNLLQAVRGQYEAQVGVPLSDPPQDTELSNPAFQVLNASYLGITDLTGLEACTSLTVLNLYTNQITDVTPISGLTNLVYLILGKNQITNIASLAGLTGLQYLDIGINQISDISALSSLTNLLGLNLGFGTFFMYDDFDPFLTGTNDLDDSDLTVLNSLVNLELLSIGGLENVTNISFLNSMNNLKQLWLGNNPISNWIPLGSVAPNLNSFLSVNCGLGQTELDTYVANMTNITFVSENEPGLLGLGLENITDISSLDQLNPGMALFVGLGLNNINVVQNWTNLSIIICAYTGITDINAILGLQNLSIAQFMGNNIGPTMFTVKNGLTLDSLLGLNLSDNSLTTLSGIEYMPNLQILNVANNQINNIFGLSAFGAPVGTLSELVLSSNQIVDINPLLNYTALNNVYLNNNLIENFGFLVDNEGIGDGDYIDVSYNPVPKELCYLVDQLEEKVKPTGAVNREGVCQVTVTIEVEGIGNVLPGVGTNSVNINDNFVILAYPQAGSGYAFDHWEIWDENAKAGYVYLTDSYNYYFSNVQEDMLLKAVFVPGTYNLSFTISPSSTGTGTVIPFYDGNGVYSFKESQNVFLYAVPDSGSCFGGWTGDAESFGFNPYASLVMNSDKTVGAIFSNQCYQLVIESSGNGDTLPYMGTYQYAQGAVVTINAYPDMGYLFDHWEDGNNNNLGTNNPITVEITQNTTIRAVFAPIPTYSLTINVNGGGTTNPSPGTYQINQGGVVELSAVPNEGWIFSGWSGDIGSANPQDNPIYILMDGNKVVTANFVEPDYTVEVSVEGPGSTNPAPGTYYYFEGQWAFLDAIPNAGKAFLGWFENNVLISDYRYYSFQVNSNRNLVARFSEPDYIVELSIQGNGITSPSPGIYGYMDGQWLYYIAYPDVGYALKYWITPDNVVLSTDDMLSLQVGNNLSIIAVFEPCVWNVNITTAGTGTGQTQPSSGSYCYINGKQLKLSAQPAVDNYFGGWELIKNPGSKSETRWVYWFDTTVTIDGHYDMVAYFENTGWNFNFQIEGTGEVVLVDEGKPLFPNIYPLANNFTINLRAIPGEFQLFKGWYSGASLISTDTIFETVLNGDLQLTAKFAPQVWYTLLLNVIEGQGTTNPTAGVEYQFLDGEVVSVTAVPQTGWMFGAWTGDIEGIENINQPSIIVPMDRNRTIGVIFIQIPPEGEGISEGIIEGEGAPEGIIEGEGEGSVPPPHSADQDGDNKISLSELLRVIQFFNLGEYHCEPGTEDGYSPGSGSHSCTPHASDYNPQDWIISLSELLRLIQFFNSGGYYPCEDSEDGYCPGTQP